VQFGGIWRSAVAPSDDAEKLQYRCTNTVPPVPKRYLGKFASCIALGAHKLAVFELCIQILTITVSAI